MPYVLAMSAFQLGAPIAQFVLIEADDSLLHFSRKQLVLVVRRDAGFHHRKIVKAMSQQTPDAITSGNN